MKRRDFLITSAAAAGATALPGMALAYEALTYTPGVLQERLAAGDTVLLEFFAPWCTTCRAQERVIDALVEETPAYQGAITFIRVDWDTYRAAEISTSLKIPRRSTLVALKGNTEIGRVVAQTGRGPIKALLDQALAAATA
jgi:thiol-disulfide isomerase/thioredoxin